MFSMRRLNVILSLALVALSLSCAGMNKFAVVATYSYDVGLESVERPADAKERYGETTISTPDEAGKYWFEDGMIRSAWAVGDKAIAFEIQNKTDHSIKIIWDEAAYVDPEGKSDRTIHEGVKFNEASASTPPTVIPRAGRITDSVSPTGKIWYSAYSGWITNDLFITKLTQGMMDGTYGNLTVEDVIQQHDQRTIQLLLPLEIEGVVNEYTFTFRILKVTATGTPSRMGSRTGPA